MWSTVTAYIARRFAQSIVILLGVTLLTFVLLHLIPGGSARGILGPRAGCVFLRGVILR